jgi:tryptophan synthase beta subunit
MKKFIEESGRYGEFGGAFMPELLVAPLQELEKAFDKMKGDKEFQKQFKERLRNYCGRKTPLTEVKNFSKAIAGPNIYLKREDLLHTGAHKINNALGQCMLAQKMQKKRVVAETGAGQHGVATATICAYLELECVIYMGNVDIKRQAPNVAKMKLLGAKVVSVEIGAQTLKDAVNEALRDYAQNFASTHYCLGSALGPHPYPAMVRFFQSVIGEETKLQCHERFGKNPDTIIACVGGGSNAIGIFSAFLDDTEVKLIGVEAGGISFKPGEHAARFQTGKPGVLHGCYSYLLQDEYGQVLPTHSISAGLDYPSVGPLHAELFVNKRATYSAATDSESLNAFKLLSKTEGIIPALESSHALAYLIREAKSFNKDDNVVVNLSGRGDKDLPQLFNGGLVE